MTSRTMVSSAPSASARFIALTLLVLGCGHSDTYGVVGPTVGPSGAGADIQLTYNPEQDYWPAWSQDGKAILYGFVQQGSTRAHRCLGILPAGGGTRIWEMCDNRAAERDSISSFAAYALSSEGKLLYVTAVSDTAFAPRRLSKRITFWLADTATPYHRTELLSSLYGRDDGSTTWFSDLYWTGENTFVALQTSMVIAQIPPKGCDFVPDSIFLAGQVVVGTISGGHATLQPVAGTENATNYALAEGHNTIVFTKQGAGALLFRVPLTGGTAQQLTPRIGDGTTTVLGLACKGTSCVGASDHLILSGAPPPSCTFPPLFGAQTLYSFDINSPNVQTVLVDARVIATPAVSPLTGDVVLQIGGNFGHVQTTITASNGELHLFQGVLH